jgi:hypothetical protein
MTALQSSEATREARTAYNHDATPNASKHGATIVEWLVAVPIGSQSTRSGAIPARAAVILILGTDQGHVIQINQAKKDAKSGAMGTCSGTLWLFRASTLCPAWC